MPKWVLQVVIITSSLVVLASSGICKELANDGTSDPWHTHPLLVVFIAGVIAAGLGAFIQHRYWKKQHEITRKKEVRDAAYAATMQAYKELSGAYHVLLGAELDEDWQSPRHPTWRLIVSAMAFLTARDLVFPSFGYESEPCQLLTEHQHRLKPLTRDIADVDAKREQHITERDKTMRQVFVAMIESIRHTREEA